MLDLIRSQRQPLQQMLLLVHFTDEETEFKEAKAQFLEVTE